MNILSESYLSGRTSDESEWLGGKLIRIELYVSAFHPPTIRLNQSSRAKGLCSRKRNKTPFARAQLKWFDKFRPFRPPFALCCCVTRNAHFSVGYKIHWLRLGETFDLFSWLSHFTHHLRLKKLEGVDFPRLCSMIVLLVFVLSVLRNLERHLRWSSVDCVGKSNSSIGCQSFIQYIELCGRSCYEAKVI